MWHQYAEFTQINQNHSKYRYLDTVYQEKQYQSIRYSNQQRRKKTQTTYELNLLDIPDDGLQIPPVEFDTELTFPSNDFQKIIRDMINIGEIIEIESQTCVKKILKLTMLRSLGDFATQENILNTRNHRLMLLTDESDSDPDNCIVFTNNRDELIQGRFSLKYLILFTKCTNLCQQIQMYIKNDYPLIIQYSGCPR